MQTAVLLIAIACGPALGAQTLPDAALETDAPPDTLTTTSEPALQLQPTAAALSQAVDGRPCDGCPPRRVGHAFLQATYINVIYGLANLARGQVTARVTPATWWDNMQQGWVWDLDDFVVNQIGHPYQGNNYFNAGRANGLSFWESAGVTAFGSGTWEYFGETNHASLNDLINTTLGGIALGEMFHRTAWLVRDTRATGRGRLMKEIGALVIDPVTGLNRFVSGDASRVHEKPAEMVPSRLGGLTAVGVLWQGSNTRAVDSTGVPFLEMDLAYGDPTTARSRTPYDAFVFRFRLAGGGSSEARVRGRLLGQPFRNDRFQLNVVQAYDYNKNDAYQFGAQSFEVNTAVTAKLTSRTSIRASGWGGLTALGAVDSIPLTGKEPDVEPPPDESPGQGVSEGPRYYDYGPGGTFGASATFSHDDRAFAVMVYEAHHLYSLDGVRANHLLQQARLDVIAPLWGELGIGASGEYFDRRTYYQDTANTTKKFHFPQFQVYLTWRLQ